MPLNVFGNGPGFCYKSNVKEAQRGVRAGGEWRESRVQGVLLQ